MQPDLIKRIEASQGVGSGLDTTIHVETKMCVWDPLATTLREIRLILENQGKCLSSNACDGYYRKSQIKVLNGGRAIKIHEKAHKELRGVWPKPNISFDEGWAYALSDYLGEKPSQASTRRELSLELSPFHQLAHKKANNGGLSEQEIRLMESLIERSGFGYSERNWTSFLLTTQNLRYYAIFHDVLNALGPEEGKEATFESAQLIKRTGNVMDGINYLTDIFFLTDNGVYDFNALPIWKGYLGRKSLMTRGTEEFRIEVFSCDPIATNSIREVLDEQKSHLEKAMGKSLILKHYD